jgi:hypothetical protein
MKRLWLVLALALAIVVALPAQSSARHTLQHRVKVLEKKTRALQGKVNCLRRTGAATFLGYAFYEGTLDPGGGPYPVHAEATDFTDTFAAANFTQAVGGSVDYWLLTVHNTRSCRRKFALVRNPYARPVMRMGAMTRLHRLSRIQ